MYLSVIPQNRTNQHKMYIRESYRENGKAKKRIIKNLGFVEDYADQFDDPIAHFKEVVAQMNEDAKKKGKEVLIRVPLEEALVKQELNETPTFSNRKNLGAAIITHFYYKLRIPQFINSKKRATDVKFNMNNIVKLLTYSRILNPSSKHSNYKSQASFFEDTTCELQNVYRTMDYLIKWKDDLLNHLNKQMEKHFNRDTTMMYYDVTNYYFEINSNDEDDGPNEGLRKKGVSKEHRPNPIVQMGLFMDDMGLPVSYELFNGNMNDCNTLQPNMETVKKTLEMKDIIVVADKGMMTGDNVGNIITDHNGYVISHTVRGANKELKDWVLKQDDYSYIDSSSAQHRYIGTKIKSRFSPVWVNVKNKETDIISKVKINERQIIYFSQKYADKAKSDRKFVFDKANKFFASGSTSVESNYGSQDYVHTDLETEELDGYYVLCTNVIGLKEDEMSMNRKSKFMEDGFFKLNRTVTDMDIIEMYGGLWEIEETFKIPKSNLNASPIFHSRRDRIEAHFLTSFISLLIVRLIEQSIDSKWSTKQILTSLKKASGTAESDNFYLFDYYDDVLEEFDKKFDTQFYRKRLTDGEIRQMIAKMKKSRCPTSFYIKS
jgi:transposase